MKKQSPSVTALRVAMRRAAHQLFDEPRIFEDHLACRLLGPDVEATLRADRASYDAPLARRLRAILVARSRHAEDALAAAVARGVRQYVILGAGYDTFAYRNGDRALRVFEVDHPATQAHKRELVAAAGLEPPPSLGMAPVDFEAITLEGGLREAGFDRRAPAFFSWLGVTPYLETGAVMETLRYVATVPRAEIVFDVAVPRDRLDGAQRLARDLLAARVAAAGEPWVSFFDPDALAAELRATGFARVDVLGPSEISALYFRDRADGLDVGQSGHWLHART